jgi:hypothetical protein
MMRALDGPTKGTSRSVPACTRSDTGMGNPITAFAARLYPSCDRSLPCRAAMSCSSPAAIMLESGSGLFSGTTFFRRPVPVLECVAKVTLPQRLAPVCRK